MDGVPVVVPVATVGAEVVVGVVDGAVMTMGAGVVIGVEELAGELGDEVDAPNTVGDDDVLGAGVVVVEVDEASGVEDVEAPSTFGVGVSAIGAEVSANESSAA
jgi:hypothetical protein